MAFMLGVRVVSYGVVGAVAILTHETTKAYKERLYHWAKGKFKSHYSPSPSQPEGPPHTENQPTHPRDAHLSSPQLQQQQQQQQQQLTVTCEDNDGLPFLPQLQHHQQPTTTTTCEEDAHLSVPLQPQQLTATKKDDDTHLSVLQQQQQLTTVDKEDVANLPMLQQQQLTAAANNHDANLLVQQEFTAASNNHDSCIPVQHQQLTAIGKDEDVYDLNDDQAVKTGHLIGTEFELKGSSETSKDHEFDDVRIEGGAEHEQQAPRLPAGGGATFFSKVFNAAKSQLHGFFCWARGLFEDKRWSTVIVRIARKIFLLVADDLFHYTFKGKHPVLRQLLAIIYNELKKAL